MDVRNGRIPAAASLPGLVMLLASCGISDPVAQPQIAQARADMVDSAPLAINGENGENGQNEGSLTGAFISEVEVWLVAAADASLGAPAEVTVQLQRSVETSVFSSALIEAQSYAGIRLIFRNAMATLEEGSTLDLMTGPVTLDAETTIFIEAEEDIVVERQLDTELDATGGGTVNVLVDLNSRNWLGTATLDPETDTGTVSEAVFAAEVEATGEVVTAP